MAIVLALVSAVMYGVSDFIGGQASRRAHPLAVVTVSDVAVFVICVVVVPAVEHSSPTAGSVGWGLAAGLAASVSIVGLYAALAEGNMTVVAPVTGVVAAIVPVLIAFALGERPGLLAVVGIVLAVVAVGLIGGLVQAIGSGVGGGVGRSTILLAGAVGVGFGLLFVAFARADGGWWPLFFARFSSLPVLVMAWLWQRTRSTVAIDRRSAFAAVSIGVAIALANATYLAATRRGMLSVVAVVVSMYPASTVALAALIDGERANRWQFTGMGLAVAALVAITLS